MTRKPLPKAITQPIANLREIAANFVADEQGRVPRALASFDAVEPEPAVLSRTDGSTQAKATTSPAAARANALAAKRRSLARRIVERHKTYAAMGGFIPLPVANIASVAAINLRMVKQLSALYQVPFERDRTRALIVGLVGGAVPTGVGTATSTTLMFIVPGGLLWGLGAAALTAGALTRAIGMVFVESFESGATAG
jgi:uncharacterized protein (DUF697 family)